MVFCDCVRVRHRKQTRAHGCDGRLNHSTKNCGQVHRCTRSSTSLYHSHPPPGSQTPLFHMGNSSSTSGRHHEDTVDFGYLVPQGVCTGPMDWNHQIVAQLICERKLAPFYRPLEEYDPSWDDEQILAARKALPDSDSTQHDQSTRTDSRLAHNKRPSASKEQSRHAEAMIYKGAIECPICFLVSFHPFVESSSRLIARAVLSAKYQLF